MNFTTWIDKIARPKVELTILEVIAGFNRFCRNMSVQQKKRTLEAIKKKSLHNQYKNIISQYSLRIPLTPVLQIRKIRNRINLLYDKLHCPGPIKDYIKNNTSVRFQSTQKLIDLTRMDRETTRNIKLKDINTSSLTHPDTCTCHNKRHIDNTTNHTFTRTDDHIGFAKPWKRLP